MQYAQFHEICERAWVSGQAGLGAGIFQVFLFMWLRTVMNVQYAQGGGFILTLARLWRFGGVRRLYRGFGYAILQTPLCRFGDTAINTGVEQIFVVYHPQTIILVRTLFISLFQSLWRLLLTPLDMLKTLNQVHGRQSGKILSLRMESTGVLTLWSGAFMILFSNFASTYPWFATYNFLQVYFSDESEYPPYFRKAFIGLCSSIVSDTCVNGLRVIKTAIQTNQDLGYIRTIQEESKKDSPLGIMTRGLSTRMMINSIQSIFFIITWKLFEGEEVNYQQNLSLNSAKTSDKSIQIGAGILMPRLIFGTGYLRNDEAYAATKLALDNGYRHIDVASAYSNEEGVGRAIRESRIKREEIFITTKCCARMCSLTPAEVFSSFHNSLQKLGVSYVDAFLIHSPTASPFGRLKHSLCKNKKMYDKYFSIPMKRHRIATWRALEELYQKNLVRAIGVSNFNEDQLKSIFAECTVRPVLNQIMWSAKVHNLTFARYCRDNGVSLVGYSSVLGILPSKTAEFRQNNENGNKCSTHISNLASAVNCSYGQVLIRAALESQVSVVVRSTSTIRQLENLESFDIALPDGNTKLFSECFNMSQLIEYEAKYADK